MSINQRIKFLVDNLSEGTVSRFAKEIGVSHTTVNTIMPGEKPSKPGFETLQKIIERFPNVNTEWLLSGKGEPFHVEAVSSVKSVYKSGNFSESKSSGNKNNISGIPTTSESTGTEIEYYRNRIKDLEDQNNKLLTQLLQLIKKE